MQTLLVVVGALLSPLLALALLFWLAHLEETLPRDVARAARTPAPPPILAIPVTPAPPATMAIPPQRAVPEVEIVKPAPVIP